MNLGRLAKALRLEVSNHPKKAAVLALLAIVAVVFWAPLVWGWVKPDSKTKNKAKVAASTPAAEVKPIALDTTEANKSQNNKPDWKKIAQWTQNDPRTTAAVHLPGRANPFDPVFSPADPLKPDEKEKNAQKAAEALAESAPDPKSLGIVLSSTVVGPHRRAALINGKTYRTGESVTLEYKSRPIKYKLTKIHDEGIVLERAKKTFEIPLAEPPESERLKISVLHEPY